MNSWTLAVDVLRNHSDNHSNKQSPAFISSPTFRLTLNLAFNKSHLKLDPKKLQSEDTFCFLWPKVASWLPGLPAADLNAWEQLN